jgi:predicted DNA-binding transcriptional regulator YafY
MRQLILRALRQPDDLVLVFDYCDSKGATTRRVVSPVRFLAADRFLALCLSREEPRQFYLNRCQNMRLDWAANFVMPVALSETPTVEATREEASVAEPQAAA